MTLLHCLKHKLEHVVIAVLTGDYNFRQKDAYNQGGGGGGGGGYDNRGGIGVTGGGTSAECTPNSHLLAQYLHKVV